MFRPLKLLKHDCAFTVWTAHCTPWQDVLLALGFPAEVTQHLLACPDAEGVRVIAVPFAPLLPGTETEREHLCSTGLRIICSQDACCVVPATSAMLFAQIVTLAVQGLSDGDEPRSAARTSGAPFYGIKALPPVSLFLKGSESQRANLCSSLARVGRNCTAEASSDCLTFHVPASQVDCVQHALPWHHFQALGWEGSSSGSPSGYGISVVFRPRLGVPAMTVQGLQIVLAQLLLASRVQAVSCPHYAGPSHLVVVQLVAQTVWQGRLPDAFVLDLLLSWWSEIAALYRVDTSARLFSGLFPLPAGLTLGAWCASPACHVRRDGFALLCIHPAVSGGGNKEENRQWAMTRLASLCLSQGVELQSTTTFVESAVSACGVPKLAQALNEPSEAARWQAVRVLAESQDVAVPPPSKKCCQGLRSCQA